MIQLSGLKLKDKNNPYGDIEITITGLRPGEKLYEELNYSYEKIVNTKVKNLNGIIYEINISFVDNSKIENFIKNHPNDNNEIKKELLNLIN